MCTPTVRSIRRSSIRRRPPRWTRESCPCSIWCGWAYTDGLRSFGKDELEVLDARAEPAEVRNFLLNIADYLLEEDVTLRDGETIGFSEEQRLPITRSAGVGQEGMTLKIGWPGEV